MADYDFSTLNSTDLEELVCDLLNAREGADSSVKYRTFKEGKDQGIDFLYSIEGKMHEHVGQVKHYYRTGFKGMLSKLENEEVDKVIKLNPNNYIFATSVDLSVGQIKKISDVFQPYIRNLHDIYGKKDLNRLLELHENVLTAHYKLWFSDTSILSKILNSDLQFRSSDFVEDELKKRIRIYVRTPLLDQVRENLKTNNFIIITGEPGVGKTTLAEMLTYENISQGYELLYIMDDIKDIEKVIRNDDSKQIFYFDDFLGSNAMEVNKAQGSESALIGIIGRIKKMVNKKLIFTTRSIILNTVINESDRFTRFSRTINEKVFHLTEYSKGIKEQLLRNHIEESEMSDVLKSVFYNRRVIEYIVSHQNFNPRSVEFITLNENVKNFRPDEYLKYIVANFRNPSEIWRKAYEHQINHFDRWVLNTLLTFDGKVEESLLNKAFNKRLEIFGNDDPSIPVHPFTRSIEKLDKGFIIRKSGTVDFINPSLKDFLINFVGTDRLEIAKMFNSVQYVKQLSDLFLSMVSTNQIAVTEDFKDNLMRNYEHYLRPKNINYDLIHVATIINNIVQDNNENKNKVLVKIVLEIRDWEALHNNYELNLII
ncbi:hypothetical protein [Chryseobacterium sp. ISL-6]|uniref:nSTAND3 domain-containing NTPase n=1 Tax=Chryseobacterium sp. ISL-6 TaxID=2819143 RepID=UPI001BE6B82F|nr:hypothetical protein [Chryseobacterium sp. ISL-6]MBT2620356.1 ATP-binding protein [Chryseobacterium sp. ISL-6]